MTQASGSAGGRLCALDDIPDGGAYGVEVDGVDGTRDALLLLRRGDEVHAFHNVCPHAGRRLDWAPGRFLISAGQLVCAAHGASFRLPDGHCTAGPCRGQQLAELPITIRDGQILLGAQP